MPHSVSNMDRDQGMAEYKKEMEYIDRNKMQKVQQSHFLISLTRTA